MLVSIIIPTYNVDKYIAQALESCLNQTYKIYEIICVDNNSNDQTVEIIKTFTKKYPKLINLIFEQKQGAAYARNSGVENCSGEWIQFLDADDILLPEKISKDIETINKKDVSLLVGSWKHLQLDGSTVNYISTKDDLIKAIFAGRNCGNTCANLWNKKAIVNVNCFTEIEDTHDPDLMIKLLLNGGKYVRSEHISTIVRVRPEGGQISSMNLEDHYLRHFFLRINTIKTLQITGSILYKKHKIFLYTATLYYLRVVWSYNKSKALTSFNKNFDKEIKLKYYSEIKLTKKYIILYNMVGFKNCEQIYYFRNKLK